MIRAAKRATAIVLTFSIVVMMLITGATMASAETSTGVGLAAHALKAYREGWSYVWGGSSTGAVDCSGLIYSYNGVGGSRTDMLGSSSEWGYVGDGIPNIHGLGLHMPGHVGVYLGSGMAVDARDTNSGVVYHNVYNKSWVEWFKVSGVSYPNTGWVLFDGDSYYYENGEYVVSTTKTIDGVTYTFDGNGVSNIAPPASAYEATDYSSSSTTTSQETSVEESSEIVESSVVSEASEESSEVVSEASEVSEESEEVSEESSEEESSEVSEEVSEEPEESSEEPEEESVTIASYGDEDTDDSTYVAEIQLRLYELGYLTDTATGYYGSNTVDAVILFQNLNDLDVTGIVDTETYEALKSDDAADNFKTLETGMFDDGSSLSITALQTRLTELQYYYDEITGYYGEITASAVLTFQSENGLEETGIADAATQRLIFDSDTSVNPNAGNLTYGQTGAAVLKMQKRLIELRYLSGIVNEKFDDETLEAVNAFQEEAGFEASETITEEQLELLYSDNAPKSPDFDVLKYGYSGDDVAELQSRLAKLKYYDGKISGEFTLELEEAVESFQEDFELDVTGIVDYETAELIKTEAQRADSQVGEQLILQTATITDSALSGVVGSMDSATGSEVVTIFTQSQGETLRTFVVIGIVFAAALFMLIIFIVELKKKKRVTYVDADMSFEKRKF